MRLTRKIDGGKDMFGMPLVGTYEMVDSTPGLGNAKAKCQLGRYEDACYIDDTEVLTLDEIKEYAQAKQEGRLVMLPVKVGQKLWCIERKKIYETQINNILVGERGIYRFSVIGDCYTPTAKDPENIGKTVFLTREAAEAALKRT